MKNARYIFLFMMVLSCAKPQPSSEEKKVTEVVTIQPKNNDSLKVSFTFDDGITYDLAGYPFEEWNQMILTNLANEGIKAAFFVTGSNKIDKKGNYLLNSLG